MNRAEQRRAKKSAAKIGVQKQTIVSTVHMMSAVRDNLEADGINLSINMED